MRAMATIVFLGCPAGSALSQSSWDRYQPGSLSSVIREVDSEIRAAIRETDSAMRIAPKDRRPSEHFLSEQYPTLATVIYTGKSRPIDPIRLDLIAAWGRSYRRDSTMAADFHREYLFQEGTQLLWLPVQDTVASFFPRELRPGQAVKLYVMLLGGYYADEKFTWAFIVNEFRAEPRS